MPVYTYECKDCGQKFELLVGVGAGNEEIKCKKCNSKNVQKIPTVFNAGSGRSSSSSGCPTGNCNLS